MLMPWTDRPDDHPQVPPFERLHSGQEAPGISVFIKQGAMIVSRKIYATSIKPWIGTAPEMTADLEENGEHLTTTNPRRRFLTAMAKMVLPYRDDCKNHPLYLLFNEIPGQKYNTGEPVVLSVFKIKDGGLIRTFK
ncbi:hypothetical protein BGX23_000299, partial [Mortierella sp. AD031]